MYTALEYAALGTEVNLVADDTDVLVLLMLHWKENMADVFFHSEARKSLQTTALSWNVRDLVSKAGNLIVSHLLLIHAWSGCDTYNFCYIWPWKNHTVEEAQSIRSHSGNLVSVM